MPKKRGNGEGSIYYDEAKKIWVSQANLGRDPVTGKYNRPTFYGKTKYEVKDKLDEVKANFRKGEYIQKTDRTFGEFLTMWLENKTVSIVNNTRTLYEHNAKHLKTFKEKKIQEIMRQDIQDLVNTLSKKYSPWTVRRVYMIAKNVFELARLDKIILSNPCQRVELPKIIEKEVTILTDEQVTKMLDYAQNTRVHDVILIELFSGLRRGEILGLTWDDVLFDTNQINVDKAYIMINGKPEWSEAGTKTESGKRKVSIPDVVKDVLQRRYCNRQEEKYVFQQKNGLPYNPNNVYREIKKCAEKAGVNDLTVHDLRHNYGTKLAESNVHQRTIEEQMGHIDYRSSRRYLHGTKKAQDEAAKKLNAMAEKIMGCSTVAVKTEKGPDVTPSNP